MSNTKRNSYEMEKFAYVIDCYNEVVLAYCAKLEASLDLVETGMGEDENIKKSVRILYSLIEDVRNVTDPFSDISESLSKSAKVLKRAESIMR